MSVGGPAVNADVRRQPMFGQLDECAYLDLTGISEPGQSSLRLVVEEMQESFESEELEIGGVNLGESRKIEHTQSCRVFEVTWETYISYAVVNESYARVKNDEVYEGRLVRVYSKSDFLEHIRQATFADEHYPGPFKHIALVCMHHIVNVVSVSHPQVRLARAGQPRRVPVA